MKIEEVFARYAADFEKTYQDDDWIRLEKYFADDAVYEVCNMPFNCQLVGRVAILEGIRKSLDGFDRQCERSLTRPTVFKVEGDNVLVFAGVTYTRNGSSAGSNLWEIVTVRKGRIQRMIDLYSPGDAEEYSRWIGQQDGTLDAAYR